MNEVKEEEKLHHGIERDKYLLAISRLKVLSVLQYTVPGTPLLYYGDEVGVYGYNDPYNRKTYPWGMEDKELLAHYQVLGKMRNENKEIFGEGDFKPIYYGNHTFVFERNYNGKKVIVAINRGIFHNEGEHIELNLNGTNAVDLLGGDKLKINDNKLSFDIESLGYKVLLIM